MIRCNNCFGELENEVGRCLLCGYKQGDNPKELYHLFPGTKLYGRYIIGESLGFGGFGITYKAWDTKLDTIVAIKEYYPSGIVNRVPGTNEVIVFAVKRKKEYEYGKDRFLDEARNVAKFNSEANIVNVFEYFEENNTAYIVMEYLEGITMSKYLHDNDGVIDVDTGIQVTEAICNALSRIHSEGIIHRDISPDNIFICVNGGIKLIDFGAARFTQDENKLMTIILKPGFAPPEQYEKINKQGPWTDIYALGATLYYIITGVKPQESTDRKITDELLYPHQINPNIPEHLSNTIMKAMAIDINLRFKDVKELKEAITQNKKVLPVGVEKKRRKRRRTMGIAAAASVLIAGAALFMFKWNEKKEEMVLPDCEITVWYCESGNKELDAAERSAYEAIATEFNSSFDNVKVNIKGFSPQEYKEKLAGGEQPNLYEFVGDDSSAQRLSLKSIYDSETVKQCSVLADADKHFDGYDCLPLGFNAPTVFVNTTICEYNKNSVSDIKDMKSASDDILIDNRAFSDIFGNIQEYYYDDGLTKFSDGKAAFFGTYSSNYFAVREKMPAHYKTLFCDAEKVPCRYTNIWCANDLDTDENKAALKFLEFMLNNNAQDELHIRNLSNNLPVNDNVLDVFVSVYGDFEGFFDNKENYTFD